MDDQNNSTEVLDAEVVNTAESDDVETPSEPQVIGDAAIMLNLEEMIKNHIVSLDKLREEQKKFRDMYEDAFIGNPTYRENAEKAKEALKVKATTRQQIASQPSVIATSQKLKGISQDIKERVAALSDYLLEYQRLTGANEIEDAEGQIREIINSAKLIRRSSK
jgi:hypothetical protein